MTKRSRPRTSLDDICSSLRSATEEFLHQVEAANRGETMYAFLLEVSCEGFSVGGAVATEEALARYSEDQLAKIKPITGSDPLAIVRSSFRWAGPEDGWYQQPRKAFDGVNELLDRAQAEGLYDMYDDVLNEMCLHVLRELDVVGRFGKGCERDRVVLGICYVGGDNSDEEFLGWAAQVNPPDVMKRLRKEVRQSRKDSERVRYF